MSEVFESNWQPLEIACRQLGVSVRGFHRLRAAGRVLPAVHFHRCGPGSRAPLRVNVTATRLALQVATRQ